MGGEREERDSGGDISPSFRLFEPPPPHTHLSRVAPPIPAPEPTVIYDSTPSHVIGRTNPRRCISCIPLETKSMPVVDPRRTNHFHIFCTSRVSYTYTPLELRKFCESLDEIVPEAGEFSITGKNKVGTCLEELWYFRSWDNYKMI